MKKVVIIGGGFGGSAAAKILEKNLEVILIDNKNYFEFTPSILRTAVNQKITRKIRVFHKDYLKKSEIVVGKVKEVHNKYIKVNNKKIIYDYLIIATGSKYDFPLKGKNVVSAYSSKELEKNSKNLLKSNNIVIIGGGLVGIELAGEIIEKFPEKNISIIQSSSSILPRNHKKAIDLAKNFLENKEVKIMTEKVVDKIENGRIITNKNEKIKCELVFLCSGISPNSDFMKEEFKKYLDEKKAIKVNKFLQVEKHDNLFAIGDVNNIKEEKTAQSAEKQGKIVAKNIIRIENNQRLKEYHPEKRIMLISLGKWNAIFEYKGIVFSGLIPAFMKWLVEKKTIIKY